MVFIEETKREREREREREWTVVVHVEGGLESRYGRYLGI
jgi:hypothetical protein